MIAGLFANRSVSSVDQILGLLDATPPAAFSLNNPGSNARLDYLALAIKWNDHFKRYLRGVGVPQGPDGTSFFDEEDNQDPLFRAKLFLRCVTGSEFLPLDPLQKIDVRMGKT